MPGVPEDVLQHLESNILRQTGVSGLVEHGGVETVEEVLLEGLSPEVLASESLRYHCRCDRRRLLSQLSRMVEDDLDFMSDEDQTVNAECSYCGQVHRFERREIDAANSVS